MVEVGDQVQQDLIAPWAAPGWFEQTSTWIYAEAERQNLQIQGEIGPPQLRPTSATFRVATSDGDLYFKATLAIGRFEVGLTQALFNWRPDCMPQVVAVDPDRGWMLTADSGDTLRNLTPTVHNLWRWIEVMPLYAEMQIESADRLPDLLELGAPDHRPESLPVLYRQMLDDADMLLIDQPAGLPASAYWTLREFEPRFKEMCDQLTAFALPPTLHHDDFHDGNIFVNEDRYIFSDWGECAIAPPFFSLLIPPRTIAWRFQLRDGDPFYFRLRDAYLEPWTRYASHDDLLEALQVTHPLSKAVRAMTYHRVVASIDPAHRASEADAVPGWLGDFHDTITNNLEWPALPDYLYEGSPTG